MKDFPGYYWIEGKVSLDEYGRPRVLHSDLWHDTFGRRIPRPANDFEDCECKDPGSDEYNPDEDGCGKCRLRLVLPFWVNNTTLSEDVKYKVCLSFWTRDQGDWVDWVANDPGSRPKVTKLQPEMDDAGNIEYDAQRNMVWVEFYRGVEKSFPSVPGEDPEKEFWINARAELDPNGVYWTHIYGRPRESLMSYPIGWYIDFYRHHLTPEEEHGIRLMLNRIVRDSSGEEVEVEQDVKQFWFYVTDAAD